MSTEVERVIRVMVAMKRARVSQTDVARLAGVTPQAISHVVCGRRRSKPLREAICRATGKSYEELWGEEPGVDKPAREANICNPTAAI